MCLKAELELDFISRPVRPPMGRIFSVGASVSFLFFYAKHITYIPEIPQNLFLSEKSGSLIKQELSRRRLKLIKGRSYDNLEVVPYQIRLRSV